ncbi:MAG: DUF3883 domain-containing protein [Lachnospiraceae bacterium]|nr:DUF3883 domain-containing protein [Lachnospiraceae bacterium]
MEYVSAILYHKIQDSDFTNMYGIKKPSGGGGQTYIQAAGYDFSELDKMFSDSDIITDTLEFWDSEKKYPRKKYNFNAIAIGLNQSAEIELAPRTGRKDYRISRQGLNHRHPAWSTHNGFPEPQRKTPIPSTGSIYEYTKNYPGIIDNLYIYILKTISTENKVKYYASFINADSMPNNWPSGLGLEKIFKKQSKQGIIFFDGIYMRFSNNPACPFASGCVADSEIENATLPSDIATNTEDAVEYAHNDVSIEVDYSTLNFIQVPIPSIARKTKTNSIYIRKDSNHSRREKNKKLIGDIGEKIVLTFEKNRLLQLGRQDLADKVEHVAKTKGDGLGYDILSYDIINDTVTEKYIEVKATTGNSTKPFDISANEVDISELYPEKYFIYRIFNIHNKMDSASFYIMKGSVRSNFNLEATSYKAYPKSI